MKAILALHIAAGGLALLAGYVALFAAKGRRWHRRSGVVFAASMLVMGLGAAALGNVVGGLMILYFVVTAVIAVHPPSPVSRRLLAGGAWVALALGVVAVAGSLTAIATGAGRDDGSPVGAGLVLGGIVLLSGLSDFRVLRAGGLTGTPRLRRHLWRMCFALFFASGSFFLGQADEIPEPLRIWPLLLILAFLPLAMMAFWLWRIRRRPPEPTRGSRGAAPANEAGGWPGPARHPRIAEGARPTLVEIS